MTENTITQHFEHSHPVVRAVYDKLIHALQKFGPLTEVPKKTSIHLDHVHGFAGIYPRKSYLLLHFRLDHSLDSTRISKCEQLSVRRFKHTVRIETETEVDDELLKWLEAAYQLSS